MRSADDASAFEHAPFALLPARFPAEQLAHAAELAPTSASSPMGSTSK